MKMIQCVSRSLRLLHRQKVAFQKDVKLFLCFLALCCAAGVFDHSSEVLLHEAAVELVAHGVVHKLRLLCCAVGCSCLVSKHNIIIPSPPHAELAPRHPRHRLTRIITSSSHGQQRIPTPARCNNNSSSMFCCPAFIPVKFARLVFPSVLMLCIILCSRCTPLLSNFFEFTKELFFIILTITHRVLPTLFNNLLIIILDSVLDVFTAHFPFRVFCEETITTPSAFTLLMLALARFEHFAQQSLALVSASVALVVVITLIVNKVAVVVPFGACLERELGGECFP
mmetsp:Transcript_8669/g.18481  ORF Transcript_8669/g.18481 Transcript_8669/m.18481 type:complete len:283 (-) Transcript_8669:103-951(-)